MEKSQTAEKGNGILEVVKAIIIAIIISLALILLSSFLIKVLNVALEATKIIVQVIKGVSIFVACLICLKSPTNRWLKGILIGIIYIIIAFFVFSLLDDSKGITFSISFLNDVIIGSASGLISGVVASVIRK